MIELLEFAKALFVFKGMCDEELEELLGKMRYTVISYSKGDHIYPSNESEFGICFVADGACEVRSEHDEKYVILNTLEKYDSFGALTLFSDCEQFPTSIYAKKKTEILFIPKSEVLRLITDFHIIALNFLRFLTERLHFLNSKISNMTSASIEERLFGLIKSECARSENRGIKLNMKKCSETLGVGRASVYRAIASLRSKSIIDVDQQTKLIKLII